MAFEPLANLQRSRPFAGAHAPFDPREGAFRMATAVPALITPPDRGAFPLALFNACLVLPMINVVYFPIAYIAHRWIYHTVGPTSS
jgi:hypothetical protein